MRSAQVSELKERLDEVIEAVKNGETVEIREGTAAVAEVWPADRFPASIDTHPLPDWFFEERLPKFDGGGLLEQLLRDRKESPW
jgi:antitoxin (DNA-binding transcriptional repressor) of toxin-antitoxin stability system